MLSARGGPQGRLVARILPTWGARHMSEHVEITKEHVAKRVMEVLGGFSKIDPTKVRARMCASTAQGAR